MLRKGSGFTLYLFLPNGQKKDAAAILNARYCQRHYEGGMTGGDGVFGISR
jgi:hypothetical protein